MRLIDADALKKDLKSVTLSNGTLVNTNAVLYLLEEYPTAYDVDKVVEQLEDRSTLSRPVGWTKSYEIITLKDAVEIVKGGGVDG
jgi:hypothetical protein|nr:MAG TPA: hypothetical protein [Caudoviricetes sp.]